MSEIPAVQKLDVKFDAEGFAIPPDPVPPGWVRWHWCGSSGPSISTDDLKPKWMPWRLFWLWRRWIKHESP